MAENRYPNRGKDQAEVQTVALAATTSATLTDEQMSASILKLTGSGGASTIQVPIGPSRSGVRYWVLNQIASAVTFKAYTTDTGTTPTTGVAIAASKGALVVYDGSDFVLWLQGA